MEALKTYLDNREDLKEISTQMLEAAHRLLASETEAWLDPAISEESGTEHHLLGTTEGQLRLL